MADVFEAKMNEIQTLLLYFLFCLDAFQQGSQFYELKMQEKIVKNDFMKLELRTMRCYVHGRVVYTVWGQSVHDSTLVPSL